MYSFTFVGCGFPRSEAELLSLVVDTEALTVLVKTSERPALVVGLDSLHLDDLGPREDVGELNWATALFLVLDDLGDVLFN